MRALLHTEFAAPLAHFGVSQAAFARLAGVTARQVNNWTRGRAAVPRWAALLAVVLEDTTAEALLLMLEDTQLTCNPLAEDAAYAVTASSRTGSAASAWPKRRPTQGFSA